MSFVLSCCDTADLNPAVYLKREIYPLSFHFRLDDTEYPDAEGNAPKEEEFYAALVASREAHTAQPGIGEYLEHFSRFLSAGQDVLHIAFSSGLSGGWSAARNAALIAEERFPERRILVVDSLAASSGYGLLMCTLADLRDGGLSLEETAAWAEENKLRLNHLFFSQDLSFYVRGGRISKAAAIFGGVLNICPVLDMNREGRLTPREKVRGKKQAIRRLGEKMARLAENGPDYDRRCFICHSACREDAEAMAEEVVRHFPRLAGKIEIYYVGPVIGCHTGPGTVALFFFGAERE